MARPRKRKSPAAYGAGTNVTVGQRIVGGAGQNSLPYDLENTATWLLPARADPRSRSPSQAAALESHDITAVERQSPERRRIIQRIGDLNAVAWSSGRPTSWPWTSFPQRQ